MIMKDLPHISIHARKLRHGMHISVRLITLQFFPSKVLMKIRWIDLNNQFGCLKMELLKQTSLMHIWIIAGTVSILVKRDFRDSMVLFKEDRVQFIILLILDLQPKVRYSLLDH